VAWVVGRALQRLRRAVMPGLWPVVPYAIGAVASFWLFERIAAF
jgi:uncharacterized membrane protein (GlpM family)